MLGAVNGPRPVGYVDNMTLTTAIAKALGTQPGAGLLESLPGFSAVNCNRHLVSFPFQHGYQHRAGHEIVFSDEYFHLLRRCFFGLPIPWAFSGNYR